MKEEEEEEVEAKEAHLSCGPRENDEENDSGGNGGESVEEREMRFRRN